MALTFGTVSIDPSTGAVSGSGMSREIFDEWTASLDLSSVTGPALAKARQQIANMTNAFAKKICQHLAANATITVVIHTTDSALQRMPASTVEDTPTKGPSVNKNLTGTLA